MYLLVTCHGRKTFLMSMILYLMLHEGHLRGRVADNLSTHVLQKRCPHLSVNRSTVFWSSWRGSLQTGHLGHFPVGEDDLSVSMSWGKVSRNVCLMASLNSCLRANSSLLASVSSLILSPVGFRSSISFSDKDSSSDDEEVDSNILVDILASSLLSVFCHLNWNEMEWNIRDLMHCISLWIEIEIQGNERERTLIRRSFIFYFCLNELSSWE